MLKSTESIKTPSFERFLKFWAQRYKTDLSVLSVCSEPSYDSFAKTASPEGRVLTITKLKMRALDIDSQMAWIQTKSLYSFVANVLNFTEARLVTESASRVYNEMLNIYQQQLPSSASVGERSLKSDLGRKSLAAAWEIPPIEELARVLEPILMEFQEQHTAAKDWRALGFMTTQLKFTNKLIVNQLTPTEKVLLDPYLKFVSEQVAIPWGRVCAASAKHELDSPTLTLVGSMLLNVDEIAQTVYSQLLELFPNHRSRSGRLINPNVAQSSIRDLNMFQAYLWLCVLEESLDAVEQELLILCRMVMEKLEIKWDVLQKWCQLLLDEVISRVKPEDRAILLPYALGMQETFNG